MKELEMINIAQLTSLFDKVVADSKGFDIYLGGGYVRDLYFNELNNCDDMEPKDIDLFFIPNGGEKQLPTIEKSYVNYHKQSSDIPDMEERGVESVRGLFVPWAPTKDVQFIIYKDSMTQQQLAEDMDCNINQVMIDITNNTRFASDAFIDGHNDHVIEMLHTFEWVRMGKRLARMSNKFPSYSIEGDWDLSEFATKLESHGSFCDEEQ